MSDAERKAADALRRFQERAAENTLPVEMANAAAEEMGVPPEEMDIPPGIVRGVFVYELEDNSFGYQNMGEGPIDVMDALTLGHRLVDAATAEMIVVKLHTYIEKAKQARAAQPAPSPLVVPRRLGRRAQ